jgi:hypothetical protein
MEVLCGNLGWMYLVFSQNFNELINNCPWAISRDQASGPM